MSAYRIRAAALTVVASIGLSACTTPYGYGGVGVGYGSGYDPYYGYEPYWGWYDGYYYPGTGYYVYDRYRRAYPWSDHHRHHWEERRERAMSTKEFRRQMEAQRSQQEQQNWSAFEQAPAQVQRVRPSEDRPTRVERSNRSQRVERSTTRTERSTNRTERNTSRNKQKSSDFRRSMEDREDR